MNDLGLLGPDTTYIHCTDSTDEELDLIASTGGTASIAPYVEMLMGHGPPPTGRLLERGVRPSLSRRRRLERAGRDVHADAHGARPRADRCAHGHAGRGVRADADAPGRARVRHDRRGARLCARGQGRVAHAEEAGRHRPPERQRDQHGADGRPDRDDRRLRRHVERRLGVRRRAGGEAQRDSSSTPTSTGSSGSSTSRGTTSSAKASCCPTGRPEPAAAV